MCVPGMPDMAVCNVGTNVTPASGFKHVGLEIPHGCGIGAVAPPAAQSTTRAVTNTVTSSTTPSGSMDVASCRSRICLTIESSICSRIALLFVTPYLHEGGPPCQSSQRERLCCTNHPASARDTALEVGTFSRPSSSAPESPCLQANLGGCRMV